MLDYEGWPIPYHVIWNTRLVSLPLICIKIQLIFKKFFIYMEYYLLSETLLT